MNFKHVPAFVILTIHFLIYALLNYFINPHPDMLDHWVWSRLMSLSYFEHPPMIAWLIRGITILGGNSEMALETGSQLVTISILALIYFGTFRLYGSESAVVTLLILCGMPYFTLGSVFLHITHPFMFFWIIALFLLVRYHQTLNKKWLLWIGVAAGLGALSKYIMLLFYMGMFIHFLLYKRNRKEIFNHWVYVAGIISLIVFIPVLMWNAQNDWVSFRWQLAKGTSGAEFGKNTLAFTAGHLLLFSPLWALMSGFALWWMRDRLTHSRSPEAVISILSLFPLLFFSIMSLKGSIADPHWVNLSYLGMAILLGNVLLKRLKRKVVYGLLAVGILFNLSLNAIIVTHTFSPLFQWLPHELKNYDYLEYKGIPESTLSKLRKNPQRLYSSDEYQTHLTSTLSVEEYSEFGSLIEKTAADVAADRLTRIVKWQDTANQIQKILEENNLTEPQFIVSREYQLSSAFSFYLPNQPKPHSIEKPERNIWSPIESVKKNPSIFVCELQECQGNLADFKKRFEMPLRYLGEAESFINSRMIRNIQVYALE